MFDSLSSRLGGIFDGLLKRGVLRDDDVNEALRMVRVALLEADVALPVAKDFVEKVKTHAVGEKVVRSVKPGGHVIVATFGPEGPTQCSGLDVSRYDAGALHDEFGARFRLVEHAQEIHRTPWGAAQQFVYCLCVLGD